MGVHLYTNGVWTDSGKIYRNSNNLFNYGARTDGYRIQWLSGELYSDPEAILSDYIPINDSTYSCDIAVALAAYDENLVYLGVYNGIDTLIKNLPSNYYNIFTLPSNVKYIRIFTFSNTGTTISSTTMFNAGSTALPYEPYNVVDWYTNNGHDYSSGAWS